MGRRNQKEKNHVQLKISSHLNMYNILYGCFNKTCKKIFSFIIKKMICRFILTELIANMYK